MPNLRHLLPGRRAVAVALALVAVAGLSVASASQLVLQSGTMQSGQVAVTGCQTGDVIVSYGYAYEASTTAYRVSTVTLSGLLAGCQNKSVRVALVSTGNAVLVELTGTTAAAAATTLTVPAGTVVNAADVARVAAVVSG
ncbi:hypothetical protein [Cellulomonas septica]|uniref:Uncharacterized protein n=1 Tax=Cellulomonas septica TaxID=285080 RepID=A0ABX1K1K3_9CELL|nr:hypothetical protein [Cellulomonas septica]NKY39507.1 hypothetical protein [Cellulomonas septica]